MAKEEVKSITPSKNLSTIKFPSNKKKTEAQYGEPISSKEETEKEVSSNLTKEAAITKEN